MQSENQEGDKSIVDDDTFTQAIPNQEAANPDQSVPEPSSLVQEEPATVEPQIQSDSSPPLRNDATGVTGDENQEYVQNVDMDEKDRTIEKTQEGEEGYATDNAMKATNGFEIDKLNLKAQDVELDKDEQAIKALTARSNLMMLQPFKRDRTIKAIFDKKKIVKQIQKDQMEKYTQKLYVQEYNYDVDDIDGISDDDVDEQDESDDDELTSLKKSLMAFRSQPCYMQVWNGIKNFLSLKYGVQFFSYDNTNNEYLKTDIGKVPQKASFYDSAKIVLTVIIVISLFITIILNYIKVLGTEKSQNLTYTFLTNMTYDLEDLPNLMPFHQYTFFDKDEVEHRIACKEYNQQKECRAIEEKRCLLKGKNTDKYEDCRINILNKLNLNASRFCVNHYNDMSIWKDTVTPAMSEYWERKHSCLQKTGIKKDRQYCDDIQSVTEGGDTDNLFLCYRRNNVDFDKEYCDYKFNKTANPLVTNTQILDCYGAHHVPKGKAYCDLTFEGENTQTLVQKVGCYDKLFLKDKDYCDALRVINGQTLSELRQCYVSCGYTLDRQLCNDAYPLVNSDQIQNQLDKRYQCYQDIQLTYPDSESVVEGLDTGLEGVPVFKDREYCEILHLGNEASKYKCIKEIAVVNQENYINEICNDITMCIKSRKQKLRQLSILQELGGDYCYITYFWEDQYDELYQCLEDLGIEKDSSYCEAQYKYTVEQNKRNQKLQPTCIQDANLDDDLIDKCKEQYPILTEEIDLRKTLWDCQKDFTSADGSPFPHNNDLACYSLEEEVVNILQVDKSQHISLPNVDEGRHECYHMRGINGGNAWWIGYFDSEIQVKAVEIYNIDISDPENGVTSSLLDGATVYIGEKKCGQLSNNLVKNYDLLLDCEGDSDHHDDDTEDTDDDEGLKGTFIKIEANGPGIMTICDVEVRLADHDHEHESKVELDCEKYRDKCKDIFTEPVDSENKFNCLKRYGLSNNKMPEACLHLHRTTQDIFYYPLMFKYQCLKDPNLPTVLNDTAADCLNKFDSYSIESCLKEYESHFNNEVGFIGDEKYGTVDYYAFYGNMTPDLESQRQMQYNQIRQERDELVIQESIAPQQQSADIENFLCKKTKMQFFSNPFYFEESTTNQLTIDLECTTFDYKDPDPDKKDEPIMIGVHYWIDDLDYVINGRDLIENEEIQGKYFINRTSFNEQHFKLKFDHDLEYLTVLKHILYQRELSAQDQEQEHDDISSQKGYDWLRTYKNTIKLYESHEQIIAQQRMSDAVMKTRPEILVHKNMPDAKKNLVFGLPVYFNDFKQDILIFDPVLDPLEPIEMDENDFGYEETFEIKLGFEYIFEKKTFIFTYYTVTDLFTDLCGLGNALTQAVSQFYIYLVILFAIQMNYLVKQKSQQDFRKFRYEQLLRKVPQYKKVIQKELRDNFMDQEAKIADKKRRESDKINAQKKLQEKKKDIKNIPDRKSEGVFSQAQDQEQAVEEDAEADTGPVYLSDEQLKIDGRESEIGEKNTLISNLEACNTLESSLQEKLDEEQLELQGGKANDYDGDVEKMKIKQMNYWELFDYNLDKMEEMDRLYDFLIKDKDIDPFNEDHCIQNMLHKRKQNRFIHRAEVLKKRISFFGIYNCGEQIEMLNAKYENMKFQFGKALLELTRIENQLVGMSNEKKTQGSDPNPRFELVKKQNKVDNNLMINLKTLIKQKSTNIKQLQERAKKAQDRAAKKSKSKEELNAK